MLEFCEICQGSGKDLYNTEEISCPMCNGAGDLSGLPCVICQQQGCEHCYHEGVIPDGVECPQCDSSGVVEKPLKCPRCRGRKTQLPSHLRKSDA